jgi:hypothetical protein
MANKTPAPWHYVKLYNRALSHGEIESLAWPSDSHPKIVRYPHAPHVGLTRRPPSFARFCLTSKPHIRIKAAPNG